MFCINGFKSTGICDFGDTYIVTEGMKKIVYKSFLVNMFLCASLFLAVIWGPKPPVEILPQLVATTFVVGLASFLVWVTKVLWEIHTKVTS